MEVRSYTRKRGKVQVYIEEGKKKSQDEKNACHGKRGNANDKGRKRG